jgi:cytoskeleton protein RodZ
MSLTLGEKLRQAREERGISISEVAEQTRISPLYIESIEGDNYKPLPGGIFNKGFVKSYAKYVGVDENEALQEYTRMMASTEAEQLESPRTYRPEVLTDDRPGASIAPTLIFAGVILALMTAGILFLVRYINNTGSPQTASNIQSNSASNSAANTVEQLAQPAVTAPAIEASKIEFRATGEPVWMRAVVDGKNSEALVEPNKPIVFEPKQSLKISYSRSRVQFAQMAINGKSIALPAEPTNAGKSTIEVEITRDNFAEIWQSGSTAPGNTAAVPGITPAVGTPSPVRLATPRPRPSPTASNTAARPSPSPATMMRSVNRAAPAATPR